MTDRYTLADVEPSLVAELPDFMRWVEGCGGEDELAWRDEEGTLDYVLLGYLRSWLLGKRGRRHREEVRAAFRVIERLVQSGDRELEGAVMVGLLEGGWPRSHLRLMGRRTRELWEPTYHPAGEKEGHYTIGSVDPMLAWGLPGFDQYVAEQDDWNPTDDDPKHVAPKLLRHLRQWLLGLDDPADGQQAAHAFTLVEKLSASEDHELRDALRVHLLTGRWPAGHLQLMGPHTVELRKRSDDE